MALFEYRAYVAVPGKLPTLHRRFETMTLGHFKRHGIGVVGFWNVLVGTSNELHYILRFDDMAHRDKAWGHSRLTKPGCAIGPKPSATARWWPRCATSSGGRPTTRR